jgi:hypothetical protein
MKCREHHRCFRYDFCDCVRVKSSGVNRRSARTPLCV